MPILRMGLEEGSNETISDWLLNGPKKKPTVTSEKPDDQTIGQMCAFPAKTDHATCSGRPPSKYQHLL